MKPLELHYRDIILRDRLPTDIQDHRRWLTTEVEWLEWDAPWEDMDQESNEQYLQRMERRLTEPLPVLRSTLEICHSSGTHIGMVNAYLIDKDPNRLAVGITIRESRFWGMGLGSQAFLLWLAYQFNQSGRKQIYCQTWSGNTRMTKLAQKCHFAPWIREKNYWAANGQYYDGLTFILRKEVFLAMQPHILTAP